MIFSPAAQHALRALIHLARRAGQGPVLVRDIAAAEDIPQPYLAKILHTLRFNGLLRSTKGPGGGFELARDPGSIRVRDIAGVFDGLEALGDQCILGRGACSNEASCPLHSRWQRLRNDFADSIGGLSLGDLAPSPVRRTTRRRGGRATRSRKKVLRLPGVKSR
jgi:Rrf2 family protein